MTPESLARHEVSRVRPEDAVPPPSSDDPSCLRVRIAAPGEVPQVVRPASDAFAFRQAVVLEYLVKTLRAFPSLPISGEFVFGLHDSYDGPVAEHEGHAVPVAGRMVFSRATDSAGVMIPDIYAMQAYQGKLQQPDQWAWGLKVPRGIFAGATTGDPDPRKNERLRACAAAGGVLDASISSVVQMPLEAVREAYPAADGWVRGQVSQGAQCAHRFIVSIDGNTAAWDRLPWILASNSVAVKVDSPAQCWYYRALEPGRHYIPAATPEQLPEVLLRARGAPDKEHLEMVAAAHQFVAKWLQPRPQALYFAHILHNLAMKQRGE